MRHRREIGDVRLAVNGLAERQRQLRRRAPVHFRFEELAQRDLLAGVVRNLQADRRFARDAIDEDGFGLHRQTQIVGEPGDLRVFHARVGLELVGRDHRSGVNLDH